MVTALTLVKGPVVAMAGTQPGKPGGSWQVTGSPRTGPGSVLLASGGAFFLSDGAAFPFSPTVHGCVPQNADILPWFPALTLRQLLYILLVFLVGNPRIYITQQSSWSLKIIVHLVQV